MSTIGRGLTGFERTIPRTCLGVAEVCGSELRARGEDVLAPSEDLVRTGWSWALVAAPGRRVPGLCHALRQREEVTTAPGQPAIAPVLWQ